jgi:hypothetical protein
MDSVTVRHRRPIRREDVYPATLRLAAFVALGAGFFVAFEYLMCMDGRSWIAQNAIAASGRKSRGETKLVRPEIVKGELTETEE